MLFLHVPVVKNHFILLTLLNESSKPTGGLNRRDKFQICCIDLYLIRFLVYSAVIHMFFVNFVGLPEFHRSGTVLNIRSPDTTSCVIYIMHLSMLSPRVEGAGYPREID